MPQSDTSRMEIEQENVADKDTEPTQPLSNTSNQSDNNSELINHIINLYTTLCCVGANEMEQESATKEEPTGTMNENTPEPTTSHVTAPLSNTSTSSEQAEQISKCMLLLLLLLLLLLSRHGLHVQHSGRGVHRAAFLLVS